MKAHKTVVLLVCCVIQIGLCAQGPIWNWESNCGQGFSDKVLDLAIASDGCIYSCGYFNCMPYDSAHFGNLNIYSGDNMGKDGFVAKQDSLGNYIWVHKHDGGLDDRTLGLCLDANDNVIVTGTGNGALSTPFTPWWGYSGDTPFLLKYNSSGTLLWTTACGSSGSDHGFDVVADAFGDIYLTGFVSDPYSQSIITTAVFGALPPISFPRTDTLGFLAKISSNGVWQWVQTFDGTDEHRENDIALDNQGGVYIAGGFYGSSNDFGPVQLNSVANSVDIFVLKYDTNGNFQWVRQVGGYNDDRANGIAFGADNYMYVTGEFRAEINFDGDTLNNNGGPGGKDIFVAKMDLTGNWKWASKAGSNSGDESGRAITTTSLHCIFITGQVNGSNIEFGGSISMNTGADSIQIFVAAIDTAGEWRWALQCGGPGEDRGYGIAASSSCELYFGGFFSGANPTFGPFVDTSYGAKDGFVSRLDVTCFSYTSDSLTDLEPVNRTPCVPTVNNLLVPNGGVDVQFVRVRNAECLENVTWTIYNILGAIVYQSSNIQQEWDGKDQSGNNLPAGTYFYQLRENGATNVESFSGSIVLIR